MKKLLHSTIALYPIVLEQHEEGGYFATCPTFQGCHASGETVGDAIDNINDIIRIHIEARRKFGDPIPSIKISSATDIRFTLPIPVNV